MPEKRRFFLWQRPFFHTQYAKHVAGRAVVARQAHNLKVGGSIHPATKKHFSIKSHSWDFFVHGNRTRCYSKCHLRHFSGSIPPPPPNHVEKSPNLEIFYCWVCRKLSISLPPFGVTSCVDHHCSQVYPSPDHFIPEGTSIVFDAGERADLEIFCLWFVAFVRFYTCISGAHAWCVWWERVIHILEKERDWSRANIPKWTRADHQRDHWKILHADRLFSEPSNHRASAYCIDSVSIDAVILGNLSQDSIDKSHIFFFAPWISWSTACREASRVGNDKIRLSFIETHIFLHLILAIRPTVCGYDERIFSTIRISIWDK